MGKEATAAAGEAAVATKPKYRVNINLAWCKGCGICMAFCPKGILIAEGLDKKAKVTDESLCIDCGMCEVHCPDFAIEVVRSED
jgi:2-oxoglutarate ferredoxin oxidoreductase subunit delta